MFDNRGRWLSLKVKLLQVEVLETLVYGCATWTLKAKDYSTLRKHHTHFLRRITNFRKSKHDGSGVRLIVSYRDVILLTKSDPIELTVRRLRLELAGRIVRMPDERLPKMMLFGNLTEGQPTRETPNTGDLASKTTSASSASTKRHGSRKTQTKSTGKNSWTQAQDGSQSNGSRKKISYTNDDASRTPSPATIAPTTIIMIQS